MARIIAAKTIIIYACLVNFCYFNIIYLFVSEFLELMN